jgi:predicted dehydrogenase
VTQPLGIGMVGYGFMGRAHSQAWRTVGHMYALPLLPRLAAICGRNEHAVRAVAEQQGWPAWETDWRRLIERDDVDLVDVSTPGSSHAEIAIAALEAGKHVLCEKPLANSVEEGEAMVAAAAQAAERGVQAMVGLNYRRVPAMAVARQLVADGRLGELRHVRGTYLQDWLVDPDFPLVWRLQAEEAGSGALGDLGVHLVDLLQYVAGDTLATVVGQAATFIEERRAPEGERGEVTVDDAALFQGRFTGGALGSFEVSRFATGRKNALRLELNGSLGSLAFDLERLNELELYEAGDNAGFRRVVVTEPTDPYMAAWWPPGHVLGWEHTFVHELKDFVEGIAAGQPVQPTFADALQVQRVLAAVARSHESGAWERVEERPVAAASAQPGSSSSRPCASA